MKYIQVQVEIEKTRITIRRVSDQIFIEAKIKDQDTFWKFDENNSGRDEVWSKCYNVMSHLIGTQPTNGDVRELFTVIEPFLS